MFAKVISRRQNSPIISGERVKNITADFVLLIEFSFAEKKKTLKLLTITVLFSVIGKIYLILVLLNRLRCHAFFKFSANQIT